MFKSQRFALIVTEAEAIKIANTVCMFTAVYFINVFIFTHMKEIIWCIIIFTSFSGYIYQL